jgi:hypothetical protein
MSTDHGHYGGHRGMHQIGARDDTPSDLDMMDASNVEDSGPQSRHTVYAFQSLQEYAASDASMLDAPDSSAPLPFSFSSPRKEQVDTSMHGLVPVEDDQFEQFGLSSGPSLKVRVLPIRNIKYNVLTRTSSTLTFVVRPVRRTSPTPDRTSPPRAKPWKLVAECCCNLRSNPEATEKYSTMPQAKWTRT